MSNPDRCQNCGAHRASHNPKAYTGCSKFRRRTEEQEKRARETEAAFFAVVKASNEAKREQEWNARRDALAAQFPVGARVETTDECFGLDEKCYGTVTGHTSRHVEWEEDGGTKWSMMPASLRVVQA